MKTTSFSQHLGTYFDEYLPNVRNYRPNTIASYQDTFRLLLEYMAEQQHIKPYLLDYKHFSDKVILSFLNWLETHRNCSPSTRNQRLSAISAFFKYAFLQNALFFKISWFFPAEYPVERICERGHRVHCLLQGIRLCADLHEQ